MSNPQELLTIQGATKYGVKANGANYYISKFLAKDGISPASFTVGAQYLAEIYTGEKGGKYINKILNGAQAAAPAAAMPVAMAAPVAAIASAPMPPALPPTTIAATPAPGGVAPVQAASSNGVKALANGTEDKMSKADWADRNREIAIQAVVKSSIESPALGEHVTGKSQQEMFFLTREFVKYNLETYRMAIEGKL